MNKTSGDPRRLALMVRTAERKPARPEPTSSGKEAALRVKRPSRNSGRLAVKRFI